MLKYGNVFKQLILDCFVSRNDAKRRQSPEGATIRHRAISIPDINKMQTGRLQALKGRQQREAGGVNPCRKKTTKKTEPPMGSPVFHKV